MMNDIEKLFGISAQALDMQTKMNILNIALSLSICAANNKKTEEQMVKSFTKTVKLLTGNKEMWQ